MSFLDGIGSEFKDDADVADVDGGRRNGSAPVGDE
jgi:hypothetical protein